MVQTMTIERTKIQLSNSLSLANDFAVKLLAGLLNMRIDYDADGSPLVEVHHVTRYFTTERMAEVKTAFSGFRLSQLEATQPKTDPESQWSRSELRHISVYGSDKKDSFSLLAAFEVHRDYLDGDNAEGWTRWRVKNVHVFLTDIGTELIPQYLNPEDREPIWGTRVS
jgi:hypothetical protein